MLQGARVRVPPNLKEKGRIDPTRRLGKESLTKGILVQFIQPIHSSLCSLISTPTPPRAFTHTAMMVWCREEVNKHPGAGDGDEVQPPWIKTAHSLEIPAILIILLIGGLEVVVLVCEIHRDIKSHLP